VGLYLMLTLFFLNGVLTSVYTRCCDANHHSFTVFIFQSIFFSKFFQPSSRKMVLWVLASLPHIKVTWWEDLVDKIMFFFFFHFRYDCNYNLFNLPGHDNQCKFTCIICGWWILAFTHHLFWWFCSCTKQTCASAGSRRC